jgi:hypothetical protein
MLAPESRISMLFLSWPSGCPSLTCLLGFLRGVLVVEAADSPRVDSGARVPSSVRKLTSEGWVSGKLGSAALSAVASEISVACLGDRRGIV